MLELSVATSRTQLDAVRGLMRAFIAWHRLRVGCCWRQSTALYEGLGFKRIEPYYDLPSDLRDWLVFMELAL